MGQIIGKTAINKNKYKKPLYFFNSARNAFQEVLEQLSKDCACTLLLPGYIGVSPNEGSGIHDPVKAANMNHLFYKIDKSLTVNLTDLDSKLSSAHGKKIVLMVHYFGFPDIHVDEMASICREHDAIIIEDSAHAMYTDLVDGRCGIFGNYTIFSIHKMLPFEDGGILRINKIHNVEITPEIEYGHFNIWDYDLMAISNKRKQKARKWKMLLDGVKGIYPLRDLDGRVTPQTYPVIIEHYDRDELYLKLNEMGYGAVSLYHTMIEPLRTSGYEDAVWLSHHIMNLPVHQDAEDDRIEEMAKALSEIIK